MATTAKEEDVVVEEEVGEITMETEALTERMSTKGIKREVAEVAIISKELMASSVKAHEMVMIATT